MVPSQSNNSTAAVIAAYRPSPGLVGTVRALSYQVDHIVIVDDGSPSSSDPLLVDLEGTGATVLRLASNQGIGSALNAGVAHARKRWMPDFVITLDQDSVLSEDYVSRALTTVTQAREAGVAVGFVCASSYSGHDSPQWREEHGFIQAFDPMQSGFVIPRETIESVGPFAADFFIDGVDSDFTMRCREANLATIIGPGCTIEHDLGERGKAVVFGRSVRVLGREISFNYHSPSRVYYICRNGTVLTKRYARRYPKWVARRLIEEAKAHLLRFLFSPNRVKLLTAAFAGFRDALRSRMGRIPEDLEKRL